jgi:putative nucleotidyltransferase with HDIG domain
LLVFALPAAALHLSHRQQARHASRQILQLRALNTELELAHRSVQTARWQAEYMRDELLSLLSKMIDARDPAGAGHARQVSEYAVEIGRRLGMLPGQLEILEQAALLHDIGKLGIPESILFKPERLTDEEYAHIKRHATLGANMLEANASLRVLAPYVRHHHERLDGNGYPDQLRGYAIPIESRIIGVCDAVEAMASDRPYRRAMGIDEIVAELRKNAGVQFDPQVVDVFTAVLKERGNRFVVNSAPNPQA